MKCCSCGVCSRVGSWQVEHDARAHPSSWPAESFVPACIVPAQCCLQCLCESNTFESTLCCFRMPTAPCRLRRAACRRPWLLLLAWLLWAGCCCSCCSWRSQARGDSSRRQLQLGACGGAEARCDPGDTAQVGVCHAGTDHAHDTHDHAHDTHALHAPGMMPTGCSWQSVACCSDAGWLVAPQGTLQE